ALQENYGQASKFDGTPPPRPPDGAGARGTEGGVRLRGGPGLDAEALSEVAAGTTVALSGQRQNGFPSVTARGQAGWGFSTYLVKADGTPAGPVARVTENGVRLRGGPGLDAEILTEMPANALVALTDGNQNGFTAVAYEGQPGWAASQFLAT